LLFFKDITIYRPGLASDIAFGAGRFTIFDLRSVKPDLL